MQLANKEVRAAAKATGVRFWQICKVLCISEATLTRLLREELSEDEKLELLAVIKQIGGEQCDK